MEINPQNLGTLGGILAVVLGLLVWAIRKIVDMIEKRLADQANAITATGERMAVALDKVNDSLSGIRDDLKEVKVATKQTADRIEAVAQAVGDITPRPRSLPYGPMRAGSGGDGT